MMKTAVVILNYNSSADVVKCVGTLMDQSIAPQMEIIIVDNASAAADRDALRQFCQSCGLTLLEASENRGYNAGNNLGISIALDHGCDAVMIANPDMEFPMTDYVERLRAALFSDDAYAVAASRILGPDGRDQNPMRAEVSWTASLAWIGDLLLRRTPSFIDRPLESHDCSKVSGSCLMLKADYLRSAGLFDTTPFLYCEEAILAKQVQAARRRIRYDASPVAIHRHIPSVKGDPRPRFRHWRRSRLYYIRRYSGWPMPARIIAACSMRLYTAVMIAGFTLKQKLR